MKLHTVAITANTSWYIYNFRKNTIKALLNSDYKVVILSPSDEYSDKLIELGCDHFNIMIDKGGTNPVKDLLTFYFFYTLYRRLGVSVVLNFTPKNNIYSTLAAKLNKIKVINNIAGLGAVFIKNDLLTKFVKFLYKFSQSKADFVFFQNQEDYKLFQDSHIVLKNSAVLPGSGVDLDRFALSVAPDDGNVVFSLVARMLIDKGVYEYAEAAKTLKRKYGDSVKFQLIGFLDESNSRSVSKQKVDAWVQDGFIQYLGKTDNVEFILKSTDCIVLPSFYREGVPKSLLEGAAMGKPIVTTNNVGCRDTVDDGVNGYLCKPGSADDLTFKMEAIINLSHSERIAMGIKGREKVTAQFDERIVIDNYLVQIKNLLKNTWE
ncbi:glycosyltransferase family 4 protein [Erwinia sp. LJJL01]|uniref:glycosyltransferase family 4 protein n=1 Tax=Erwinia sp. LJJL01 TaxID=3391839 RepID=UPI00105D3F31